jgi:hypothetical protein
MPASGFSASATNGDVSTPMSTDGGGGSCGDMKRRFFGITKTLNLYDFMRRQHTNQAARIEIKSAQRARNRMGFMHLDSTWSWLVDTDDDAARSSGGVDVRMTVSPIQRKSRR